MSDSRTVDPLGDISSQGYDTEWAIFTIRRIQKDDPDTVVDMMTMLDVIIDGQNKKIAGAMSPSTLRFTTEQRLRRPMRVDCLPEQAVTWIFWCGESLDMELHRLLPLRQELFSQNVTATGHAPEGPPMPASASEVGRLPSIAEMMEARNNTCSGFIKSYDEYLQVSRDYQAQSDRPNTNCSDFPVAAEDQQGLVSELVRAMVNTTDVAEPPSNAAVKKIAGLKYSNLELELVGWKLLNELKHAQQGHCHIPGYYSDKKPAYRNFINFIARYTTVFEVLWSCKDAVKSLFLDELFAAKLAWNPEFEAARKETNRRGNSNKVVTSRTVRSF
ncbi:hypothetical protein F4780DRAFT_798168 [Xylariomycetidae sp. FL0641]|nr:hypothetical protein F4780DRAFT_798168 [Xylariomycetidae sp. FL0641]